MYETMKDLLAALQKNDVTPDESLARSAPDFTCPSGRCLRVLKGI